jgi:hypothetical protein
MARRFVAQIIVLIALGFSPYLARAACEMKQYATVDIEVTSNGGVLVPVQINGHDAWMSLNMSSGMPIIGPQTLQMLGLKPIAVSETNLFSNGARITQQVKVDSLRMGKANFTDWMLYVNPGQGRPPQMYKGRPTVGVLSAVFMNVVDMELDIAGRKMNLFQHTLCKGEAVYWGGEVTALNLFTDKAGLMYFPMEVDGKRVETSLNTQDRRSLLSERVTRDFFGFKIGSSGVRIETVRGQNGKPVKLGQKEMSLSAKGLELSDMTFTIQGDRAPRCAPTTNRESGAIGFDRCNSIVPMELGTDVLQHLRIYIASKENRIYFTRVAPAPANADGPNAGGGAAPAATGAAGAAAEGQPAGAPPAR